MTKVNERVISQWKQKYGQIFVVSDGHRDYYFRSATLGDFLQYANAVRERKGSLEAEDDLARKVLIHPDPATLDFNNMPAGIISTLVAEVLESSGFTDPKLAREQIEAARERSSEITFLMAATIMAAMPQYKFEDLLEYQFHELATMLSLAEKILHLQQSVAAGSTIEFNIIDPEEEEAKAQADKRKKAVQRRDGHAPADDPIARRLRNAL